MPESDLGTAYRSALEVIAAAEPDVADAIAGELTSQRRQLKLVASENYASPAVLLAMGNWLSDKYAEGTPGHRLYAGCEMVDRVETLAINHAKALFDAEHAYVQPHSGIDANLVAYWSILAHRIEQPALLGAGVRHVNDLDAQAWERLRKELHSQRMMGMALDAGGHLTHGFRPNISGKLFDQASYGSIPRPGSWTTTRSLPKSGSSALWCWWLGTRRTRATPTSPHWPASPTRSVRRSWSTWPTSPAWWPGRCLPVTSIRLPTPTS